MCLFGFLREESLHGSLLVVCDGLGVHLRQVAVEEHLQREVLSEAVVGAATVLVVIRPDLLGARARPHLLLARRIHLVALLLQLHLEEPRPQQLHRHLLVPQLRALLLTEDADARRLVNQIYRSLHLIHILPTSSR